MPDTIRVPLSAFTPPPPPSTIRVPLSAFTQAPAIPVSAPTDEERDLGRAIPPDEPVAPRRRVPLQAVGFTDERSVTVTDSETTPLSAKDERRFQQWAHENGLEDVDHPDSHYDYRGFWQATKGAAHPPGSQQHFPDTYKQHGHPTFSVESKYSTGPADGGHWVGDTFVRPGEPEPPHRVPVAAYGVTDPASVRVTSPEAPPPVVGRPGRLASAKTGGVASEQPLGSIPILDDLPVGARRVAAAVPALARAAVAGPRTTEQTTVSSKTGQRYATRRAEPPTDETLAAANELIEGAFQMGTPLLVGAAITNPIITGVIIGAAGGASAATEKGAELLGATPPQAKFAGNLAAILAGHAAAKATHGYTGAREAVRTAPEMQARQAAADALGVDPYATPEEVKTAYREAAKAHHPDVNPDADPTVMADINLAYEWLVDHPAPVRPPSTPTIARKAAGWVQDQLAWLKSKLQPDETPADRGGQLPGEVAPRAPIETAAEPTPTIRVPLEALTANGLDAATERRVRAGVSPTGQERRTQPFTPEDAEPHTYSSTQVNLPDAVATSVRALAEQIPDEDLAKDGRETTPHITVKYGLHTQDADKVRAVLQDEPPITVTLGKTSMFPNGESDHGDVVKIDVDSPDLHRLNAKIAAALKHTDTFPDYHPHVTVAYVKPGKGQAYVGDASLEGQTIALDTVRFSVKDGEVVDIPLNGRPATKVNPPVEIQQGRENFTTTIGEAPSAAEIRVNEENDRGEHGGADSRGPGAEAGGGDRVLERPSASDEGPPRAAQTEDVAPEGGRVPAAAPETRPPAKAAWELREDAIAEKVKASKATGATHLDQMPMGVEALRGRRFLSLRDGKPWIARTVDTRGTVYLVSPDGSTFEEISGAERGEFVFQASTKADLLIANAANKAQRDAEQHPERQTGRYLKVNVATGHAEVVQYGTGHVLGRKDVIVAEHPSGTRIITKAGDQVTPTDRAKVKRGEFTAPEMATSPDVAASGEVAPSDTTTGAPEAVSTRKGPQAAVTYNGDRHSIEVKFPAKPEASVLEGLKRAGYKWAKCVDARDLIRLADGQIVPAGSIIGKRFEVLAVRDDDLAVVCANATAGDNGRRPVLEIRTESGRVIRRTGEHPLWGDADPRRLGSVPSHPSHRRIAPQGEWVLAQALKPESVICLAAETCPANDSAPVSDDEVRLAAYLIADGGTSRPGIRFTQQKNAVLAEFHDIARRLHFTVKAAGVYDYRLTNGSDGTGRLRKLLTSWGLFGCTAATKRAPAWVWQLDARRLALFLSRLFACDGSASLTALKNGRIDKEVKYVTVSRALADDVLRALLRVGIYARIVPVRTSWTHKGRRRIGAALKVRISEGAQIRLFADRVGIFGKEPAVRRVSERVSRSEVRWRTYRLPRGFFWERVVSVTKQPATSTVSLTIPGYSTFITEFVEHNTNKVWYRKLDAAPANDPRLARIIDRGKEQAARIVGVEAPAARQSEQPAASSTGTPQVPAMPGTAVRLPSFVTSQYVKPAAVAETLVEAQNAPEEPSSGRDTPRGAGQLPERGEPTAGGGGTPREGVLGGTPPEPRGAAPAAAGGGRRAGDGDSSGVVAAGVREPAPPSAESGNAPARSPFDRPRVPPGRALSPSGASGRDPGVAPPDYTLTPERITSIITRGPMVRARDNLAAIRLVKEIERERRWPTPEEQEALAKYVGWGASDLARFLADAPAYNFSTTDKALWQDLRDATTPAEREGLRGSSPYAHFTFDLYRPMWAALERAGFTRGRVLEPSVGTGHALGFMPAEMREASTINAVELEPLTAAIAQALYPSARVQAVGYEKARIAKGTQDVIIGNPPFGKFGVADPHVKAFITKRVHNYFFAKALEHVRPGGLVMFIATHHVLDSQEHQGVRRYLMDQAHFLGAVRLPSTAFDKSAKTEVVTDIIVLQRLQEGETAKNAELFIEAPLSDALSSSSTSGGGRRQKVQERNIYRSSWYDTHPELVLGAEGATGTMYGGGEYNVTAPKDQDLMADLATALSQVLPVGTYAPATTAAVDAPAPTMVEGAFKVGEFKIVGGKVMTVDKDGQLHDATPSRFDKSANTRVIDKATVARIAGMVEIRDLLRDLRTIMRHAHADEAAIKKGQKALGKAYDAFVKNHGTLNAMINRRAFQDDPEAANLIALEVVRPSSTIVTDRTGKKTLRVSYEVTGRADIFTKRTIHAPVEITKAETPHDALLASLGTKTRIDWPYMATITGRTVPAIQTALKAEGKVFEQPDGSWALRDEYLSGDVVSKLGDADAAAADEPQRFQGNVDALQAMQPAPKTADEISVMLGANWVDLTDVRQFVADELGLEPDAVGEISVVGTETFVRWTTAFSGYAERAGASHPLAVKYGPNERYTYGLDAMLSDALNLQLPSLGWYEGSGDERHFVKDPTGTMAARANIEELRAKWTQWVYAHPDAQQRMVDIYNTRFNRTVKREFDGSHIAHLAHWAPETKTGTRTAALPGLALPFPMHPHQLNAVWRMLTSGNTLLAHEVGAGKTYEMIIAAMEMRRTGRARKPLITVPTYLLAQWRQAILEAYPEAKLLAFEEKDLDKAKRQQAMARIAYGDWDIVLVPHSSFQLLKVSDARMATVMQAWIDELLDAEEDAKEEQGASHASVKQLAAQRRRIEDKVRKKAEALNKSSDNALTWEDLGVDALMVDEAHAFKNLFFFSNLENLRGLSRSESDRALDLYVKVQDINEQSGHRNLVLATATPVMNSMAELFTMQRYLQPQRLAELGFENFDNWYRTFAQALPTTEQRPDGTYQEVMRLRAFQNLDLLYRTMAEVMDYVGWEDMPYLQLPKLKGGRVRVVQTDPHPMYPTLKTWFTDRLAAIRENPPHVKRDGTYVAPERMDPLTGKPLGRLDNILTVMTDAKLAAVDVRLVLGDRAKDVGTSRLQIAAKDLYETYKAERAKKGVQLVFLDVGTPREGEAGTLEFLEGVKVEDQTEGGALGTEDEISDEAVLAEADNADGRFNLYDALKTALVKRGVPSREIAYIHQARNAAERLALFQAANDGTIRFVFASTDKGGVGMNIQTRLAHIAHIDAPRAQRPGDIRQRDGRGIRQGNTYPEIQISRYVTKGTTDEWLYGLLMNKSNLITSFMRGGLSEFTDEDPSTMSIEEAQMRAAGDPRGIELTELRAAMNRLKAQADSSDRALGKARADVTSALEQKALNERAVARVERWVKATHVSLKGDAFTIQIAGTTYAKRSEANTRLIARLKQMAEGAATDPKTAEDPVVVGEVGGLPIKAWAKKYKYEHPQVYVNLDASALGEGDMRVSGIEYNLDDKKTEFGAGRDVVASIVNVYAGLPAVIDTYREVVRDAEERLARAQKLLAKPSDAGEKYRAAKLRVEQLEAELKAEGAAQDVALTQERTLARQAAAKAGATEPSELEAEIESDIDAMPAGVPTGVPSRPTGNVSRADLSDREARAMRPDQITQRLAKMIGDIPMVVGQTRGNLGLFKKQGVIRTQIAGDFRTTLHELGHAIDRLVMPFSATHTRGAIAKELKTIGEATSKPSYDAGQRRREGVAEYVARWLLEPDAVRGEAPQFTIAFETFIASHHPVGQALAEAQAQTQQWLSLTPGQQFDLLVDFGDGKLPEWAEASVGWALGTYHDPRTGWNRLVSALSDDKHRLWEMERALTGNVIDPGESVYWLARLLPGSARRAEGFIKFKVRDAAGTVLGPGLEEALTGRLDKYRDIATYMVAQRAERAHARGLPSGFTPQGIAAALRRGEDPEVQKGAQGIAAFRRAFLDYLVSEEFLAPSMRAKWEKAWGDTYIPFKRVSEAVAGHLSGSARPSPSARQPRFFKRFTGKDARPIEDPITTLIEDVYAGTAAALENTFLKELFDLADVPGAGPFLERIQTPKTPETFSLSTIKTTIVESLKQSGIEIEDSVALDEGFLDDLATVWVPAKFTGPSGKHYISYLDAEGQRVWGQVHDQGLWELLDRYGAKTTNALVKALRPFARPVRSTATLNLPWMMRNLVKDYFMAMLNSPQGYSPLATIRGLTSVLKEDEDWQLYLHSGAGQATFNAQDRDVFKRQLRRMDQGRVRKFLDMTVFHPFDMLAALREMSEQATRVGAAKLQLEAERHSPEGLTEAGLRRVGVIGREITQDFQKIGSAVRDINQVTAFTAARVGGITRGVEEAKANPGRVARRLLPYLAFVIGLWMLNKDDDEYDAIESSEKNLYFHVPVPRTLRDQGWGPFLRLARPFEYGSVANVLEGFLDWQVKRDPQWAERIGVLDYNAAMDLVMSIAPDAFLPPFEVLANYDTFRHRSIINPHDLDLDPELQYNRWTSETAKRVGSLLHTAPWKVDHVLSSYFTGVYRMTAGAADHVLGDSGLLAGAPERVHGAPPLVEGIIAEARKAFYAGEQVGTADLDEFYMELTRLDGAAASIRRYLKAGDADKARTRAEEEGLRITIKGEEIQVTSARLHQLRKASEGLKDLRGPMDRVYHTTAMTPAEKRAALNDIREQMVNLARQSLGKGPLERTLRRVPDVPASSVK